MANATKSRASRRFFEMLPKARVNPMHRIEAALDVVKNYFLGKPGNLKADDNAAEIANHAVLFLLTEASSLIRHSFWQGNLDMPKNFQWELVPESDVYSLRKKIRDLKKGLWQDEATRAQIVDAMNLAVDAFTSMNAMFAVGRFRDEIPEIELYRCAALLPPTAELLDREWRAIQQTLKTKTVKRGNAG